MKCLKCEGPTKVLDSRSNKLKTQRRRTRECVHCAFRFSTQEIAADLLKEYKKMAKRTKTLIEATTTFFSHYELQGKAKEAKK